MLSYISPVTSQSLLQNMRYCPESKIRKNLHHAALIGKGRIADIEFCLGLIIFQVSALQPIISPPCLCEQTPGRFPFHGMDFVIKVGKHYQSSAECARQGPAGSSAHVRSRPLSDYQNSLRSKSGQEVLSAPKWPKCQLSQLQCHYVKEIYQIMGCRNALDSACSPEI